MFSTIAAPLPAEPAAVLAALASDSEGATLRLNEISAATGFPTGHVGRHLRTLERDRLVRFTGGGWEATPRGYRVAAAA